MVVTVSCVCAMALKIQIDRVTGTTATAYVQAAAG